MRAAAQAVAETGAGDGKSGGAAAAETATSEARASETTALALGSRRLAADALLLHGYK